MDNSTFNVTNTTSPVTLNPGEFRIFGNATALSTNDMVKPSQSQN